MLVGTAKDPSGSLTTCWIERLENNVQPQTHFNPYRIISIVIPQENHKTGNKLAFYDHDNMTGSTRKGSKTLSSCREDLRSSQAAHAHDSFLVWPIFNQGMKQRPQAKVSARSPKNMLREKHCKASLTREGTESHQDGIATLQGRPQL